MTGYSAREVAEVLGLPAARIRSWTRSGLLSPERDANGAPMYSFQDIVLLRTARELMDDHVPAQRVRRALESLRGQLPQGRPLSAVRISAQGRRVIARDDRTVWEPDSGQIQLDLGGVDPVVPEIDSGREESTAGAIEDAEAPGADDWYNRAVDLEADSREGAVAAYERALALHPEHADALLNLGRLLHEDGDLARAEERYRAAAEADPANARAHYNLGVVLEDRGHAEGAIEAYRLAIRIDADFAAAHYNVARLLQAAHLRADALRHLREYRRLTEPGDAAV